MFRGPEVECVSLQLIGCINEEGSKQAIVVFGFFFFFFLQRSINSLLLEAKGIMNLV